MTDSVLSNIIYIPPKKEVVVEKGVGEILFEEIPKHFYRIAQIDPVSGKSETYKELYYKSIRVAQNLQKRGFGPKDIISLCTLNNLDYSAVTLAAFFIGAYTSPLDPTCPLIDILHNVRLIQPKIIFCDSENEKIMEKVREDIGLNVDIVVFGADTKNNIKFDLFTVKLGAEEDFKVVPTEDVHDTACVHFSSGTTGSSKGVCLTHNGLLQVSYNINDFFAGGVPPIFMIVTNPYWVSNITSLTGSCLIGSTRVLPKEFHEETCIKHVQQYKVEMLFLTPLCGSLLIKDPVYYNYNVPHLKIIVNGGIVTPMKLLKRYFEIFPKVAYLEGYGLTETSGLTLKSYPIFKSNLSSLKKIPMGTPIPGYTYKVVDPENEEIYGPNQTGELRVKCPTIFKNYYNNLKAYEESFDSEGFFKTGDLCYYNKDHVFTFVSRFKDLFKFKGWHISPTLIEEELLKHPNIKEAVVFGTPVFGEDAHATAAVVVKDEEKYSEEEIINFIEAKLPDKYYLRGGVYKVQSIPMNSVGKFNRKKVQELCLAQQK